MKIFLVISALIAIVVAKPQKLQQQNLQQLQLPNRGDDKYKNIPIVAQENVIDHQGTYHYTFEGGDGSRAQQDGQLKYLDTQNAGEAVQGGFSYQGDDGKTYSLSYTADENGYRPVGDHLPTSPPIPKEIQKALDYLRSLPSTTETPQQKNNGGRRF